MELKVRFVETYPFTIEAQKPDGEWCFICAMENKVLAENVAEDLKVTHGMVVRLVGK